MNSAAIGNALPLGTGPLQGYQIQVAPKREKTARAALIQLIRCQASGDVAMARTIASHVHNGATVAEHVQQALGRWLAELLGDESGEDWVVHHEAPTSQAVTLPAPPPGYQQTTYWGEFVPAADCPKGTRCAGCAGDMDPTQPCGYRAPAHPTNPPQWVHVDCWRHQVEFNSPDPGISRQIMGEELDKALSPGARQEQDAAHQEEIRAGQQRLTDKAFETREEVWAADRKREEDKLAGSDPEDLAAVTAELQRRHQDHVSHSVQKVRAEVEATPVTEEPAVTYAHGILEGWPDQARSSKRRLKIPCLICRLPITAGQDYKERSRTARVHVICLEDGIEREAIHEFSAS